MRRGSMRQRLRGTRQALAAEAAAASGCSYAWCIWWWEGAFGCRMRAQDALG